MVSTQAQSRICIEKLSHEHQYALDRIVTISNSHHHAMKLSAAFFSSKIWPNFTKITIAFMISPNRNHKKLVPRTSLSTIRSTGGDPDPLQLKYEKKNSNGTYITSIPDAIQEIVQKRIQPIVGLKFVFINDVNRAYGAN